MDLFLNNTLQFCRYYSIYRTFMIRSALQYLQFKAAATLYQETWRAEKYCWLVADSSIPIMDNPVRFFSLKIHQHQLLTMTHASVIRTVAISIECFLLNCSCFNVMYTLPSASFNLLIYLTAQPLIHNVKICRSIRSCHFQYIKTFVVDYQWVNLI